MPQPFHIICLQDPPLEVAYDSPGAYKPWHHTSRELTEHDNPRMTTYTKVIPSKPVEVKGVAFYIYESIPVTDWRVEIYDDQNADLLATLHLNTSAGIIHIHNVYNRQKLIDMEQLASSCRLGSADILLGDFNLHHHTWSGPGMRYAEDVKARQLYHITESHEMELLSKPGTITFSRSIQSNQRCSTIDLVFGGRHIVSRASQWNVVDVFGFESDHRVTQTVLDLQPNCAFRTPFNSKKANTDHVRAATKESLKSLNLTTPLKTPAELNEFASSFNTLCYAAITATVPKSQLRSFSPDLHANPDIKLAFDRVRDFRTTASLQSKSDRKHSQDLLWRAEKLMKLAKKTYGGRSSLRRLRMLEAYSAQLG